MKFTPLTDQEYDQVSRLTPRSLTVCPTCGGRNVVIPGSGGQREWQSEGYNLDGKHFDCDCREQRTLYCRYLLAGIGDQYMRLDWEQTGGTSNPEANKWVQDYLANWDSFYLNGFGLTFSSKQQGVGKTWCATQIGKELIKRRVNVVFQDFVAMVDAFCSDNETKRAKEAQMSNATLLILDDVRAGISERQNDLYALKFEVVIRHRTNFNLPTIFTTNLTEDAFESEFERIHSLINSKQMWLAMGGVDYRKRSETAEATAVRIAHNEAQPIT